MCVKPPALHSRVGDRECRAETGGLPALVRFVCFRSLIHRRVWQQNPVTSTRKYQVKKKRQCVAMVGAILASLAITTATYANPRIERLVRSYFKDAPVMVRIAKCESGFHHYDPHRPSRLLTNPDPRSSASGVFQILLKTHGPTAAKLGIDLRTVEGQLQYARHLYRQNGTRDWTASRSCWG